MNHIERLRAAIENPKALKREQWQKIQQFDPKLAEILKAVNKTFGKPEQVNVVFKQEK